MTDPGGAFTGDIPAMTGLLGNERGAGFGGGPLIAGEKFAPKIICQLFMKTKYSNLILLSTVQNK